MKHVSLGILATCIGFLSFSAPAQAEDIMSILARKAETPPRAAPSTIPYSYKMTLNMVTTEGDDIDDDQAVLRIDPSQPAGSRAQIISVTNPESEAFVDFLKDIEDPEKEMAEQADGFWCGSVDNGLEEEASEFDPVNFEVVSETPSEAIIRPHLGKLAELLMQSEETEDMSKKERKLMKKLMERVEGEITLSKPNAEMKGFRVTMTRPLKMMIVAKIKVMDVEQNCALAPNGFYHMSTLNMNVEGKALGTKFGQKMDIQISDLRLLP